MPVTLVWFVKFSRLTIFDFPIMHIIQPNGSLGDIISAPFEKEVARLIGMGFKGLWRGMLAFAILIASLQSLSLSSSLIERAGVNSTTF